MSKFRTMLAATAITGGALVPSGLAVAAEPSESVSNSAKQVLDILCVMTRGTAMYSPYAISRCQEARSNKGFEIERLVCEGILEGEFVASASFGRPNRTNWACIATSPTEV